MHYYLFPSGYTHLLVIYTPSKALMKGTEVNTSISSLLPAVIHILEHTVNS